MVLFFPLGTPLLFALPFVVAEVLVIVPLSTSISTFVPASAPSPVLALATVASSAAADVPADAATNVAPKVATDVAARLAATLVASLMLGPCVASVPASVLGRLAVLDGGPVTRVPGLLIGLRVTLVVLQVAARAFAGIAVLVANALVPGASVTIGLIASAIIAMPSVIVVVVFVVKPIVVGAARGGRRRSFSATPTMPAFPALFASSDTFAPIAAAVARRVADVAEFDILVVAVGERDARRRLPHVMTRFALVHVVPIISHVLVVSSPVSHVVAVRCIVTVTVTVTVAVAVVAIEPVFCLQSATTLLLAIGGNRVADTSGSLKCHFSDEIGVVVGITRGVAVVAEMHAAVELEAGQKRMAHEVPQKPCHLPAFVLHGARVDVGDAYAQVGVHEELISSRHAVTGVVGQALDVPVIVEYGIKRNPVEDVSTKIGPGVNPCPLQNGLAALVLFRVCQRIVRHELPSTA